MRRPRPPGTIVRSCADLTDLWESLMGPGGFGTTSLWLVFLDATDRLQPVIVPIDDLPPEPDDAFLRGVCVVVTELIEDGAAASVAMLLSRPGPAEVTGPDRRWALALRAELRDLATAWPMHLATYGRVRVLAPDDLLAAG
ncbi:MAG TPA: hypothetical protein VFU35_03895 [Jatrophihabitans sp.]|nr:hypothetical protein [Jatrophihabitans sp.]